MVLYVYGSSIRGVSGGGFNTDEGLEEEEEDRSAWILFDTDGDAGPEADSDANIVWFNGEEEGRGEDEDCHDDFYYQHWCSV